MNWSFQLYSARHTPLDEALRIIAASGYRSVESFRDNFADSAAFRQGLDDNRLSLASMHINIEPMREDFEACIQQAREFSCTHIVCPYLLPEQRPVDSQGWQKLASELSGFAKRWHDAGCTFAWHNHDFEFVVMDNGELPIDVLLNHAPEMHWEADVAWIVRAGADPLPAIERFQARISAVHLKDIAEPGDCEDEDGWADLGQGVVDWKSLVDPLSRSSATLYVMEHDNPSELSRFASRSIDYANRELSALTAKLSQS